MKAKDTHKEKLLASVSDKVPRPEQKETEKLLTPEEEVQLKASATRLVAIGRRSTEQAFDYGLELAKVQAILPAKRFGAWLTANVGISTKSAKNFTRVHFELGSYRDRMEKLALAPSAMFALLGADDLAINDVLETIEAGEQLTVAKIKVRVGGNDAAKPQPLHALNIPGRAGFIKVAQERVKVHVDLFYGLLAKVLSHIEQAVADIREGKRVIKKDLMEAVVCDCRHAHDIFKLTLAPLHKNEFDPSYSWQAARIGQDFGWGRLQDALRDLGGADGWKKDTAFKPWLVDEIYPLLKFAVRGEVLEGGQETSVSDIAMETDAHNPDHEPSSTSSNLRVRTRELRSDNVVRIAPWHDERDDDESAAA